MIVPCNAFVEYHKIGKLRWYIKKIDLLLYLIIFFNYSKNKGSNTTRKVDTWLIKANTVVYYLLLIYNWICIDSITLFDIFSFFSNDN